jgi:hypothetical protein
MGVEIRSHWHYTHPAWGRVMTKEPFTEADAGPPPPVPRPCQRRQDQLPKWGATRMKQSAIVTLLVCVALLAGCVSTRPMTEAERDYQQRAEEQRRVQAIMTGY